MRASALTRDGMHILLFYFYFMHLSYMGLILLVPIFTLIGLGLAQARRLDAEPTVFTLGLVGMLAMKQSAL